MAKVIVVSGYFNPIHKGHIEYFKSAKEQGDQLWVIVNNDQQRELKGSKEFQKEDERLTIIQSIRYVDLAMISHDKDRTVRESLKHLHKFFGSEHEIFFANGGDQNNESIPEAETCKNLNIGLIEGLGDKIQSSSWLLKK
jgi:cytidyltransferase-like protein